MFFRRKGWLRAEFDEKLIEQINEAKKRWDHQNILYKKSFDPFGEMELQTKLARAKYLYLLREAKRRSLSVLK
ncbi:YaaL family protein [Bacillus sp. V3B]|uniref:YaaL family protein n=1 Tax=Bacillus sp. V3B TaxID=2804915 RepID=UPI00210A2090|nr:YaaL family protein [Bacillus sp. V3B]MCQ6277496.1 YaaL family protein [Bacillus sp. V3B]